MSVDSESGALVWRRFKVYYRPVPENFAHRPRLPMKVASKHLRRAKPIELLERRIMRTGGFLSTAMIDFEPVDQNYWY